jgi:hypothetical protein
MVDYRLHAAVSGEIYRRGEHQRQQEEDSGEVHNRFAALVKAVSVAEVDESPPSPFPEPAGDDWDAFSQTAPHIPKPKPKPKHSRKSHTSRNFPAPRKICSARRPNRLSTKFLGKTTYWSRVLVLELGVLPKIRVLHRRTKYLRTNIH